LAKGEQLDVSLPEELNLGAYFLDINLELGRGNNTALHFGDGSLSFNELSRLTNRVGNVLRELGVEPENRVLLILDDSPEWVATWLAAMKIGAVGAHAYTYLTADDYAYLFDLVKPKVAIVDSTTLPKVRQALKLATHRPKSLLVAGEHASLGKSECSLRQLVGAADERLEAAITHRDDLAFWNFSGGTTGKPKGVPHMHRDGVVAHQSFNHIVSYSSDDVVLRVPKLFFHYSRDVGLLFPLRAGAAVVLSRERTTTALVFDLIRKHKPSVLITVPTMMRSMIQTPRHQRADLSCIRYCMSSGETLSKSLYEEWTSTFGGEVINRFGSAESGIGYLCNRPGAVVPGSSGTVSPLSEVKLLDQDGQEPPIGQPGVLMIRSDAVGTFYVREHEKSKATFMGDEWVNTGDVFTQDEKGYFWYAGRADELVKVSGVWISPLEIERTLHESPSVKECVAMGVRDRDGLTKIKAFVVLNDGANACEETLLDLTQFCRQRMAPHKVPRTVEFMSDLPKTGQGKIDRRRLRERAL
jgi:benzoate-CoA ligase family protein